MNYNDNGIGVKYARGNLWVLDVMAEGAMRSECAIKDSDEAVVDAELVKFTNLTLTSTPEEFCTACIEQHNTLAS